MQFSATHGGWVILFIKRNRHTFICQPTGEISLEKERNIQDFSEKYAEDKDFGVKYMHHLASLNMMKQKRERGRREKAERESNVTDEDVEWGKLCEDLLRRQRFLYIERHNPTTEKKLKKELT